RRARRRRDALPARSSRRGDHVLGDGRPPEHHLGPIGESAPRPEGAARGGPRRMSGQSGKRSGRARPVARAPQPGSLYERYKDALRRGHVAALRSRNEAAVDAYGEAAEIAPDRALPHVSIGGILVKMNRLEDALESYERAIALAPRDEG